MFVVPQEKRLVQVGDVFTRLTVVGVPFYAEFGGQRNQHVVCKCSCGTFVLKVANRVKGQQSCGCLTREMSSARAKRFVRHGETRTRLHRIWAGMLARCNAEYASGYNDYGGRGIAVCKEWGHYETFRDWALQNGYDDDLTIERVDADGNYEPTNCKWVTRYRQMQNRRTTTFVEAFGEKKSLSDWVNDRRCTINRECLRTRLRLGWKPELAISEPKQ